VIEGIVAFLRATPEARERVAVLTDLLAYLRERRRQPGTSPEGVEMLEALARRLEMELATGTGETTGAAGTPTRQEEV
jgi:hypothetical protein